MRPVATANLGWAQLHVMPALGMSFTAARRSSPWVFGILATQLQLRLVFDFCTPASLRSFKLPQAVSDAVVSWPDHAEASTVASLHAPLCTYD
jgi:hypothetical protein